MSLITVAVRTPMDTNVDILLATYNGERYLDRQIVSILNQTHNAWRLLIRDDCSTDRTPELIEHYRVKHPDRITVLDHQGENLGSCQNFSRLLQSSTADYVMFSDQDDVWLPVKVGSTLELLLKMENRYGKSTPILVHTDMKVVNETLEPLSDSFWSYQNLDPEAGLTLNRLLLRNVPTGSTVMINRALREISPSIPEGAIIHDWWLALTASVFGKIGYLSVPTLLYRQHRENLFGASRWSAARIIRDFCIPSIRRETAIRRSMLISRQQEQAEAFLNYFGSRLPNRTVKMIKAFATLTQRGFFRRRFNTVRYGFWYSNLLENIGLILFR